MTQALLCPVSRLGHVEKEFSESQDQEKKRIKTGESIVAARALAARSCPNCSLRIVFLVSFLSCGIFSFHPALMRKMLTGYEVKNPRTMPICIINHEDRIVRLQARIRKKHEVR